MHAQLFFADTNRQHAGQGMSGSLTRRSVDQVLQLMGLGAGDRFIDLGSGVGHVTLQVRET
jgi:ubiquinone/menaquinone biosynthesis C-methylase UbiE